MFDIILDNEETPNNLIKLSIERYPDPPTTDEDGRALTDQDMIHDWQLVNVQRAAFIKGVQYCVEMVI